jgi:hypothetical protein
MLLKSATAKWERLQKTVAKPFPIEPRGSFCRFLAASSQLSTYLYKRFQLNCSESSWPDPVKHSACHLPDNLQSLVPSNTFDSVCVFGQKK